MQADTLLVNRYQLQRELSYKAGRRTFLAEDTQTEQRVIAKILQFDQILQWDEFRLFEREAQTLKHLGHPAIPKYLDSWLSRTCGDQKSYLREGASIAPLQ